MAKKRDEVSEKEAIQRARELFGEDGIAKLQALSPEDQKAFLRGFRSLVKDPHQNRGGRPPGSGKMDLTPAFRRMAELQVADPTLEDRPAARRVAEEVQPGLNVSPETLRKEYRKVKAQYLAEIREQKRPRPRFVASVVVGASGPGSGAPAYFGAVDHAAAVEDARRVFAGPDIEALKAAVLGPSVADFAAGAGAIRLPETAGEMAERLLGSPASDWIATQERMRQAASSTVEDAIRGLDILLGKKPPG